MSNHSALEELVAICREGEAFYRNRSDSTANDGLRETWQRMAEARAALAQRLDDSIARPAPARAANESPPPDASPHEEVEQVEDRLLRAFLAALEQRDSAALRGVLKHYLPQMSACRRTLSARDGSRS